MKRLVFFQKVYLLINVLDITQEGKHGIMNTKLLGGKIMVKASVKKTIDNEIKRMWLEDICTDYGNGYLLKEASLQCSIYHHLMNRLGSLLKENNLCIYPEFYFKDMKYFADIAIVEMDMNAGQNYLADDMTDVVAIIELKYDGGTAKTTSDYIKSDIYKIKDYAQHLKYDCQYYFGVIYETECYWLHWADKRTSNNWADGCLTELNAGYLDEKMYFEINSYNHMNVQQEKVICEMKF